MIAKIEYVNSENYEELFDQLKLLLSDFEKEVATVFVDKKMYTYEEMAKIVSKKTKIKCDVRIIANALFRIKRKGMRLKKEIDDKE